jgi:MOB kinase activator 1
MSLGGGDVIRNAVRVPPGENRDCWIAMNTIELYNTTMLCYGMVSEFCTRAKCPLMSAGKTVEYRWPQGKDKAPLSLSAPEYVDMLADWIYSTLSDPAIFPAEGTAYGKNFMPACRKILGRLFRVFAHIYT